MEPFSSQLSFARLLIFPAAGCVAVAILGALVIRVRRHIAASALLEQVARLLQSGNRARAVKLCGVVDTPATRLALYALGLEEPAQVFGEAGGFRDNVPATPFADRARRRLGAVSRDLQRRQRSLLIFATLGLLGSGLAGASWLVGQPALDWPGLPQALVGGGLIGAVLGIRTHSRIVGGLRLLERGLLPLLVPLEDLGEEDHAAAAAARVASGRLDRA